MVNPREANNVWKKNNKCVEAAMFHKKNTWLVEQHEQCVNAARMYLKGVVKMIVMEKEADTINEIQKFKVEVATRLDVPSRDTISLAFLNWCAPCSIKTNYQQHQAQLFAYCLSQRDDNLGMLQLPVYAHAKGHLRDTETKALDMVCAGGAIADQIYIIPFTDRHDQRDTRPLTYPGRILYNVCLQ